MVFSIQCMKVYPYANRWVVKADYEHEGVTYKRKSFSIKGDGLAELLGIPSSNGGTRAEGNRARHTEVDGINPGFREPGARHSRANCTW